MKILKSTSKLILTDLGKDFEYMYENGKKVPGPGRYGVWRLEGSLAKEVIDCGNNLDALVEKHFNQE